MSDWRFDFVVLDDADGEPVIGLRVDTVMDRMLLHETSRPRGDDEARDDAGRWTGPIGRAGRRKPE